MFSHDAPNGVFKVLATGGAEVTSFAQASPSTACLRHGASGNSQAFLQAGKFTF
jgi:hypothetical protein